MSGTTRWMDKHLPIRADGECWIWQGQRNAGGYGRIYHSGKSHMAHRFVYEQIVGPIPDGKVLRHRRCDNPPCCNPDHLTPGTDAENVADMVRAGRQAKGARQHSAKLTENIVAEIRRIHRAGGATGRELARRYGVAVSTMAELLRGETWRHVPMEES